MKKITLVIFFFVALISSGYCETGDAEADVIGYEIILKDGRSIETKICWENGDKLVYQKYGSTIGLSKSEVEEVKKIKSNNNTKAIQSKNGDSIIENTSRNANYGCTEAF